jgi:hypothetical protein
LYSLADAEQDVLQAKINPAYRLTQRNYFPYRIPATQPEKCADGDSIKLENM